MGGIGSGGKNATHKRAEDYTLLDIKKYVACSDIPYYMLDLLHDPSVYDPIQVTESKKYFICPICKKNVRTLYIVDDVAQCRKCGNLNYESQQSRTELTRRKEEKEFFLQVEKIRIKPFQKVVRRQRFKDHSKPTPERNHHAEYLAFVRRLDRTVQGKKWKELNADIIAVMETPEAKEQAAKVLKEVFEMTGAQLYELLDLEEDSIEWNALIQYFNNSEKE